MYVNKRRPGLTNGYGVDGVGVAIVVAVVIVLSAVATGDHKDAAKSLSACNHTMLQRCLVSKERSCGKKEKKVMTSEASRVACRL